MANAMFMMDRLFGGTSEFPSERGRFKLSNLMGLESQLLPSDALGNFELTLKNVAANSICEIEVLSTGSQIAINTADGSDVIFNVPVYISGDAKNDIRIKVRKASFPGPYYQPFETQTSIFVGSSSIFVNQVRDDI